MSIQVFLSVDLCWWAKNTKNDILSTSTPNKAVDCAPLRIINSQVEHWNSRGSGCIFYQ